MLLLLTNTHSIVVSLQWYSYPWTLIDPLTVLSYFCNGTLSHEHSLTHSEYCRIFAMVRLVTNTHWSTHSIVVSLQWYFYSWTLIYPLTVFLYLCNGTLTREHSFTHSQYYHIFAMVLLFTRLLWTLSPMSGVLPPRSAKQRREGWGQSLFRNGEGLCRKNGEGLCRKNDPTGRTFGSTALYPRLIPDSAHR